MVKKQITLAQAISGHLQYSRLHHSPNTTADYNNTFKHLKKYLDPETPLTDITEDDIADFLIHMRETPYNARRGVTAGANKPRHRRPKTMQNMHTALGALWAWATSRHYTDDNIMTRVPRPKTNPEPITPLTTKQVQDLMRSVAELRHSGGVPVFNATRPCAQRDLAIIALLIEGMLRASELTNLRLRHLNLTANGGTVHIDLGKNSKSRTVPFGRRCGRVLADYLVVRDDPRPDSYLFLPDRVVNGAQQLTRDAIYNMIKRAGDRAGFDCWPHLLRTTGACLAIRNGISPRNLQIINVLTTTH